MQEYDLFSVMVYGKGGLVGSFRAVAKNEAQAKGIANMWAGERGFSNVTVKVYRNGSKPVYGIA